MNSEGEFVRRMTKQHLKSQTLSGSQPAKRGSGLFRQSWRNPHISQSVTVTRPRLSSAPGERKETDIEQTWNAEKRRDKDGEKVNTNKSAEGTEGADMNTIQAHCPDLQKENAAKQAPERGALTQGVFPSWRRTCQSSD